MKRRRIAQSCRIQGGGSHALLCVMQEPPTMKPAAFALNSAGLFSWERGADIGGFYVHSRSFCPDCVKKLRLANVAGLVSVDHFLDHLTADGTRLTGGEVAVVTVLEVYADFIGSLDLELFKSLSALITGYTLHL